MDDLNRSISQHIKSGKYYSDAHSWYANKFVYIITERSYMAMFAAYFIIGICILGMFYMKTSPTAGEISYLVPLEDITKKYATINHIGSLEVEPQINITEYMLTQYVIERESYSFKKITEQLANQRQFVQRTTSPTEYLKYQNYISINNPSSPVMLYQDSNKIDINVTKVVLLNPDNGYQQASVYFQSTLYNFVSNKSIVENLVANISFQIDNIEQVINKDMLSFLVSSYSVRKVKTN